MATHAYIDKIQDEIRDVPDEYMPALLAIVHAFRMGVVQNSMEESFKRSWEQAQAGETYTISSLWGGMEDTDDYAN